MDNMSDTMPYNFKKHIYITTWKFFTITYINDQHLTLYVDKTFFDNLKESDFVQTSVGKNKDKIIDLNVRSSKTLRNKNISIKNREYISLSNIDILNKHLNCKVDCSISLLKYDQGDHFNEFHYDTLNKKNVATVLIFPPKKFTPSYTGGDLVFKQDSDEFRINTSNFDLDYYTIIMFDDILHKCEPILSGTRYVFKTTIFTSYPNILDKSLSFKMNEINEINRIKEHTERKLEKKKEIKDKMIAYYTKLTDDIFDSIDSTESNELNDKMTKSGVYNIYESVVEIYKQFKHELDVYIESSTLQTTQEYTFDSTKKESIIKYMTKEYELSEHKYNVCVLSSYIENCKDLSSYPYNVTYYIKYLLENNYNVTSIQINFNCEILFDDGYFKTNRNSLNSYSDDFDTSYKLIYSCDNIKNGKHLEHSSEYNDESGYDIYDKYECTCLVIWK
jgi:hypothetical protein